MKLIMRPRQQGKTYEAVQWVKEDPDRVLMVCNLNLGKMIAKKYGLTDRQIITPRSTRRLAGRWVEVAIDNVELCYPGEIPAYIEDQPVRLVTIEGPGNE